MPGPTIVTYLPADKSYLVNEIKEFCKIDGYDKPSPWMIKILEDRIEKIKKLQSVGKENHAESQRENSEDS